jgi:hypothetical protein
MIHCSASHVFCSSLFIPELTEAVKNSFIHFSASSFSLMDASLSPGSLALVPPLESAVIVKGLVCRSGSSLRKHVESSLGRSWIWQRGTNTQAGGVAALRCADLSCSGVVEFVSVDRASHSKDTAISSAGLQVKASVAGGEDLVVVTRVFGHSLHCGSPPSFSLKTLATLPSVQRILVTANSHNEVIQEVRHCAGFELCSHDVSRLADHFAEQRKAAVTTELTLLIPTLAALEKDSHENFGAELRLELGGAEGERTVYFGRFRPEGYERPALSSSDRAFKNARIAFVAILWSWARDVEGLGPPVLAADAAHLKTKEGVLLNVSMRLARSNVTLLNAWARSEDESAWSDLLTWGRNHLRNQLQPGTSLITDRGGALRAAVRRVLPRVQHLYDRPHLKRNVAWNFPELKKLAEELEPVLNAVFYARTAQALTKAVEVLMQKWGTVKSPGDEDRAPPPLPDDEYDEEDPLSKNTRPRTLIERKHQHKTPEEYILDGIKPEKFVVGMMQACCFEVSTSNAAEQQGAWQLRSVRYSSITAAIPEIVKTHVIRFCEMDNLVQKFKKQGEIVFPGWPGWETFEEERSRLHAYELTKLDKSRFAVTYDGSVAGGLSQKSHEVRFDFDVPFPETWDVENKTGHSCNGGCYLPQSRRAPCVHMWRALQEYRNPADHEHEGPPSNASTNKARQKYGKTHRDCILKTLASYYQVDVLVQAFSKLPKYGIPNLADLPVGPALRPLKDVQPPNLVHFAGHAGGRPAAGERRLPSNGETELSAAAGKSKRPKYTQKRQGRKNTCRTCRERGYPGRQHTRKSPECPFFKERMSVSAGTAGASQANTELATSGGAAASESTSEDDAEESDPDNKKSTGDACC